MTLKPLGDSAWLVEFPSLAGEAALAKVTGLAAALAEKWPQGVLDVVSSFNSLAVHFAENGYEIRNWICAAEVCPSLPKGPEREIPVCYGGENGPDLCEVAAQIGRSEAEVIRLHSEASYTVAAVGFLPGFPYLTGLPASLALPRRQSPRMHVPAGSVAIGGGQAGIYPFDSPGGWHLLGSTNRQLFDPEMSPPALLRPGDRVKFIPVEKQSRTKDPEEIPQTAERDGWIEVLSPGAMTSVQDLGRPGWESCGVSPGGAVNRRALQVANLLVGNEEGAAALEICVSGPILLFRKPTIIALAGTTSQSWRVAAGEVVDFSKQADGIRSYLAIAGGIRVKRVLGSASTDVRASFGGFAGRTLKTGDVLATGPAGPSPPPGNWHVGRKMTRTPMIELRFLRGVQDDWFSKEARECFRTESYQLTPQSDRMGARLSGKPLELATPREMISQPVTCGSVQVPPDGQPIVLLAARQTIGGYPQIGHIVSIDLPLLGQAWPGTRIRFREVPLEQALFLKEKEERDFDRLRIGLELLK